MIKTLPVILVFLTPALAMAECVEPELSLQQPSYFGFSPHGPAQYQRPDVPDCLLDHQRQGYHTCDEGEMEAYFERVQDYIEALNRYVADVTEFAQGAAKHAADTRNFAVAAEAYAQKVYAYVSCEARTAQRQHQ